MGRGKRSKEVKSNITDNESAKMTTSKGTIQGYNGVATVDKKHQVIIDAQALGEGQEHYTLQPGRPLQEAAHCPKKHQCMQNPASANHRKGSGRQVSFTIEKLVHYGQLVA